MSDVKGYDGRTYKVGDRVELHPGCDLWMRGARYGTVMNMEGEEVRVELDKLPSRKFLVAPDRRRLMFRRDELDAALDSVCGNGTADTQRAIGQVRNVVAPDV